MQRNKVILLVVLVALAAAGVWFFILRRRVQSMNIGMTAATPQPQTSLVALQAPGAPAGLPGLAGQAINAITSLLPPVAQGLSASFIPQNTPKPSIVTTHSIGALSGLTKTFASKLTFG